MRAENTGNIHLRYGIMEVKNKEGNVRWQGIIRFTDEEERGAQGMVLVSNPMEYWDNVQAWLQDSLIELSKMFSVNAVRVNEMVRPEKAKVRRLN